MSKKPIIALVTFVTFLFSFAYFFTDIFTYFLISMVLATLLNPIINFTSQRLMFPRGLSILTSVLVVIGFIGLLLSTFIPLISEQIQIISAIDTQKSIELIKGIIMSSYQWLIEMNLVPDNTENLDETIKSYLLDYAGKIEFEEVFNTVFSFTGNVFVMVLAVSFITFFLTYNPGMIKKLLLNLVPNAYFEITTNAFHKIEFLLGRYFRGIFIQMFSIFTLVFVGLSIAEVNYAVTIALFAAVINLIPYVGPMIGAVFGILIGISTAHLDIGSHEFYMLLSKIGIVFAIVQITDNVVLQPLIFSKSLKAHPLEIFVIIFVGANLGGALGMVLAMPFYTIFKVSISELVRGYNQYRVFKIN